MTDEELKEIERRWRMPAKKAGSVELERDVVSLLAEVKRLRAALQAIAKASYEDFSAGIARRALENEKSPTQTNERG